MKSSINTRSKNLLLEEAITQISFQGFEFGSALSLTSFIEGEDYNHIGEANAFYFFRFLIEFEVTLQEGLIHSFDIVMKYQKNHIWLGPRFDAGICLNTCSFASMIDFLFVSKYHSDVDQNDLSIININMHNAIKMKFHFEPDQEKQLVLISICSQYMSSTITLCV